MLVLAIDISTSVCSLALYDGQRVLASWSVDNGFTHSERLLPQLQMLLANSALGRADIGGIAVSIGPGSFTGLRIGLAVAKGMAYALSIPVVGVTAPRALAFNLPVAGVLLSPLIDAQKGDVYQAVYEWVEGELIEVEPLKIKPFQQALDFLLHSGRRSVLLGDCLQRPEGGWPTGISVAPAHVSKPCAASVAVAAYERLVSGDVDDLFTLEPYYLKRSEAEILWEKRQANI